MTGHRSAGSGGRPITGGGVRSLSRAALAAGPDALAGHAWLLESFVRRTAGVTRAIVVTGDGLVLAASGSATPTDADRRRSARGRGRRSRQSRARHGPVHRCR